MCLADEGIVDHLLLHCKVVHGVWSAVLSWFGRGWVHPRSIQGLFEAWHLEVGLNKFIFRGLFPLSSYFCVLLSVDRPCLGCILFGSFDFFFFFCFQLFSTSLLYCLAFSININIKKKELKS